MGKINILSFEVANLIAAGEVVDRPASCIKELVENSIDSGADRIAVEIQRGGVLYMRVSDNGCGISPEDLPVAVRRHATSKIKDPSDLNAIMTLGFRGEALAAICSVADVRIISKVAGAEYGAQIEVNSGRAGAVSERGAQAGTTVIVENLFANVPARLKFLKRDQTEAMAVCASVEKIAMSHPEISFRLISDGQMKLETPGDGKLSSAIKAVYGKDFASKILPVDYSSGGVRAYGYVTVPDAPRANRNFQNFFINGRYVKTRTAQAAIEQAYTSYIPPDRFPGCVMNLEITPEAVDVNVHPSKLEVKFSNERPVFDSVYNAVRNALVSNAERPGLDSGRQTPVPEVPKTNVSGAFVPVTDYADRRSFAPEQMSISGGYVTPSGVTINLRTEAQCPQTQNKPGTEPVKHGLDCDTEIPAKCPQTPLNAVSGTDEPASCEMPGTETENNAGSVASGPPDWRIAGEILNCYIIVEEGDTITVIDKHAAHERLIFEKLKANMRELSRTSVLLAVPIEFDVTAEDAAVLEEYSDMINSAGFRFTSERNRISVTELPDGIPVNVSAEALFADFAQSLKNGGELGTDINTVFEKALYQVSCKAAIKGGRVYPEGYSQWLVAEMHRYPCVTYCPHGRPVAITFSRKDFDRRFDRI